jgi:hypothetical protein
MRAPSLAESDPIIHGLSDAEEHMRTFLGAATTVAIVFFVVAASAQMGRPIVGDVRCVGNCGTGSFWTILGWLIGLLMGVPLLVAFPLKSAKEIILPVRKPFPLASVEASPESVIGRLGVFLLSLIAPAAFVLLLYYTDLEALSALWIVLGFWIVVGLILGLFVKLRQG